MVSVYNIHIVGIRDVCSRSYFDQRDLGRVRLVAIECRRAFLGIVRNNPCSNQNLHGNRCDTPNTCAVMSVNYGMVRDGMKYVRGSLLAAIMILDLKVTRCIHICDTHNAYARTIKWSATCSVAGAHVGRAERACSAHS